MSSIPICSICCERFTPTGPISATKCGHMFHDICIKRWLSTRTTCPECRQEVTSFLCRIYLNFNDSTEEISPTNLNNEETASEIEDLVLQLSLEEAKREEAEKASKEYSKKQSELADLLKKTEKELQRLNHLLGIEKALRRTAEESEKMSKQALQNPKQSSTTRASTACKVNERRAPTCTRSANTRPKTCCHHITRSDMGFPVDSYNSRNHVSNLENIMIGDSDDLFPGYINM